MKVKCRKKSPAPLESEQPNNRKQNLIQLNSSCAHPKNRHFSRFYTAPFSSPTIKRHLK